MGRVINSQLIDYLLQNSLITRHQHGFYRAACNADAV